MEHVRSKVLTYPFFWKKGSWFRARRLPNSTQPAVLLRSCTSWMLLTCSENLDSRLRNCAQTQVTNPELGQGMQHCTSRTARARQEGRCSVSKGGTLGTKFRCGEYWDCPVPDFLGPGIFPIYLLLLTLTRKLLDCFNIYLTLLHSLYATVSVSPLRTLIWDLVQLGTYEHGCWSQTAWVWILSLLPSL